MPSIEDIQAANQQEIRGYQKEVYKLKTKIATVEAERDKLKADYDSIRGEIQEVYAKHHQIEIITMSHGF